ncbi:MAG: acyl-CoA desaturase [Pirellulales bacterium]
MAIAAPQLEEQQDDAPVLSRHELGGKEPPPASMAEKSYMLAATILPPLGLVAAMALAWQWGFMGWSYVAMFVIGWIVTASGITIGFHRLMTHRSFETYRLVRVFWMIMGALAVQGSPLVWCAVHRRHHEMSDQPGDPHSPHLNGKGFINTIKGFWYAQVGWLFSGYWAHPELKRYVPDLTDDRLLVAVDRVYYLFVALSLAIPAGIGYCIEGGKGALLGVLWGGLARIFFTHHVTWAINSVCHLMGRYDYESGDESRNNPICAILAMGEGWHNNHHAFPTSARHGLEWWQFDSSWIVIRTMQLFGLAWSVKVPSEKTLASRRVAR